MINPLKLKKGDKVKIVRKIYKIDEQSFYDKDGWINTMDSYINNDILYEIESINGYRNCVILIGVNFSWPFGVFDLVSTSAPVIAEVKYPITALYKCNEETFDTLDAANGHKVRMQLHDLLGLDCSNVITRRALVEIMVNKRVELINILNGIKE